MSEVVWLIGVPLILIGITIWQPSLVTAVPAFLGIYVTFVVGLFNAPFSTVVIVWLAFSIAVIPFLLYKFPGQYNFARSLTALFIWPILATISAIVERQVETTVPPDKVPSRFEATVSYIDSAGTDGDYLIVFTDEFEDTVFHCDATLESDHELQESARFTFCIERRSVDELGDDVLWISSIERSNSTT